MYLHKKIEYNYNRINSHCRNKARMVHMKSTQAGIWRETMEPFSCLLPSYCETNDVFQFSYSVTELWDTGNATQESAQLYE